MDWTPADRHKRSQNAPPAYTLLEDVIAGVEVDVLIGISQGFGYVAQPPPGKSFACARRDTN
jgi:hypothetical protein